MSVYTNVTIPEVDSTIDRLRLEIKLLEVRNKTLSDQVYNFHSILKNIPEAVQKYGYVDVSYENTTIKLIAAPVNEGNK